MQRKSEQFTKTEVNVGIDVSKAMLDVFFIPIGKSLQVSNNKKGFKDLIKAMKEYHVSAIGIEATGKYHIGLHQTLHERGYHVVILNPYRSRKFADARGQLAKSDKIDAKILALFVHHIPLEPTIAASDLELEFKELALARQAMVREQTALKNRLASTLYSKLKKLYQNQLKELEKQLKCLDCYLLDLMKTDQKLSRWFEILTSIPGIGRISAITLIALMPELGTANNKQIAALLGVAPMNWDSGTMRGKRKIKGGRFAVRNALYMPAMTLATRSSKTNMHHFYTQMINRGKPAKIAIIAVMRKLIILANTLIKKNELWKVDFS